MIKSFNTFVHQGEVKVTVAITCRDRDGSDLEYDIELIQLCEPPPTADDIRELVWDALSGMDQLKINQKAEDFATEHAHDAYQWYAEGMADQAYDSWRDELMERMESEK